MNPTETTGKNWPSKKPTEKLEILRRYRDFCKRRGGVGAETADTTFARAVMNEGLTEIYFHQIKVDNIV